MSDPWYSGSTLISSTRGMVSYLVTGKLMNRFISKIFLVQVQYSTYFVNGFLSCIVCLYKPIVHCTLYSVYGTEYAGIVRQYVETSMCTSLHMSIVEALICRSLNMSKPQCVEASI